MNISTILLFCFFVFIIAFQGGKSETPDGIGVGEPYSNGGESLSQYANENDSEDDDLKDADSKEKEQDDNDNEESMSHPADESISEEDDSKDDGTKGEESNDSDEESLSQNANENDSEDHDLIDGCTKEQLYGKDDKEDADDADSNLQGFKGDIGNTEEQKRPFFGWLRHRCFRICRCRRGRRGFLCVRRCIKRLGGQIIRKCRANCFATCRRLPRCRRGRCSRGCVVAGRIIRKKLHCRGRGSKRCEWRVIRRCRRFCSRRFRRRGQSRHACLKVCTCNWRLG